MDRIPKSTVENLPHECLAAILKLVVDSPVLRRWNWALPFPVAASHVNHRWRAITLASPELWTTIRLADRSQSWKWATLFVKRSRSYPLDISISLQSSSPPPWLYAHSPEAHEYIYESYGNGTWPIPFRRALDILGPHIRRWRTFALRCWEFHIQELREFLAQSPGASQLQSARISLVHTRSDYYDPWQYLPPLPQLFGCTTFRSLRTNTRLDLSDSTFGALQCLDISFGWSGRFTCDVQQILGASSPLRTLVIRNFYPEIAAADDPINAPTIRSLAISFTTPFFHGNYYGGFNAFTNAFSFPNLEYLEIIGGFSGTLEQDSEITVPEEWHAPLFPHLRTLRLEHVGFGRNGLAFIQSLSSNITALHLIYTTGNERLLEQRGDDIAWPALRVLTVQPLRRDPNPRWLGLFLGLRSRLDLTIPPWLSGVTLPAESPHKLHWLSQGPSLGLMDGVDERGPKFYIDDYYLRANDFEKIEMPKLGSKAKCRGCWRGSHEQELEESLDRLEEEIAEAFRVGLELVRTKSHWRESRKERQRDFKVRGAGNKSSKRRSVRHQRCDFAKDFSLT
ncbi:hypothetical protein B0H19DRAFT_1133981 [Mycena capillaripes]|nr:hypothetical protein B0H19DRAFT_1133981 [Mycena capillaripes]